MKPSHITKGFLHLPLTIKCCILVVFLFLSSFLYQKQWDYGLYFIPSLSDGTKQFSSFTTEFFQKELSLNTLNLHYTLKDPASYGITSYEISLGGFYTESEDSDEKALDKTLFQLHLLGQNSLTTSQQLTLDTLTGCLEEQKMLNEFPYYPEYISPSGGTLFQLPVLFAEYELNSAADIEEYLVLLSQTSSYFEQLMEYERKKSEALPSVCAS